MPPLQTAAWFKWLNTYSDALLLMVAVVTGAFVFLQVREAARLRREQAQPYVAVDMRQLGTGDTSVRAIELVVKNYGTTAAHDVRLESDPPLVSTHEFPEEWGEFRTFDVLPTLVPGQEWSTLWEGDSANRYESNLPQAHDVTVRYKDSRGRRMDPTTFRLDWSAHKFRVFRVVNGPHEIHAELKKIRKDLDSIKDGQSRMKVLVRSEGEYQASLRNEHEEMLKMIAEQNQPANPEQPAAE